MKKNYVNPDFTAEKKQRSGFSLWYQIFNGAKLSSVIHLLLLYRVMII